MQQMEQSGEQWRDWQREADWKRWSEKERRKKKKDADWTYIWIVPSHNVSDDNRSIFKFQLWKKERTSLENSNL